MKGIENYADTQYENTALSQVIMRIDLKEPFDDSSLFSSKQEIAIKKYFPNSGMVQKENELLVSLALDEMKWQPMPTKETLRKEYNNSKNNKFVLANQYILFDIQEYHSFEECMTWFRNILPIFYGQQFKTSRIGLRYINLFCDKTIKPKKNYFSPSVGSNFLGKSILNNQEIELFRSMQMAEYKCGDYILNFRFGLYNPRFPSKLITKDFSLDYDCYISGEAESFDELLSHIDKEHQIIQEMFEKSITNKLREAMNARLSKKY